VSEGQGSSGVPNDRRALVAIDLGAESCRVSLLRWLPDGPSIHTVHRFPNFAVERDGELRWPLQRILEGLQDGLRSCGAIASEGIRSIAVDGWAVDYVRLDAAGNAVGDPFCYRDSRTLVAEAAVHENISAARMREITGVQVQRINTVYQLHSDKAELAKLPWLNLPEYVLYWLGARPVAELTNATHSQFVDLDGNWSSEIFAALGHSIELAPTIVPPGTEVGQLQGELAALPPFADTRLIAPCCHDTASAIAGIPESGDDWAYISSGTWSLVGMLLDAPETSVRAAELNFTNLAAAGGKVCFHKGVNGLWLLRQCMDEWRRAGVDLELSELLSAAETVEARSFVLEVDDPELLGQGEMPARINKQLRLRGLPELDPSPGGAAAMVSLILHSLASRYAEILKRLEELTGRQLTRIHIVGGGGQNRFLNRLVAEATGLSVAVGSTESSTIGNFAVQLASQEDPRDVIRSHHSYWAGRLTTVLPDGRPARGAVTS